MVHLKLKTKPAYFNEYDQPCYPRTQRKGVIEYQSGTHYIKDREKQIAKEHYFQWSFSECESNLSEFFSINYMCTTTFIPFVPKIWKYLLPVSDSLGEHLLRKYGANILAVCQKR